MMHMTIDIERTPRTANVGGQTVHVEELSLPLPFARKPGSLAEVGGSERCKVFVIETREMSSTEFDIFSNHLLASRDWLAGKGGYCEDGRLCIEIKAPGRPTLYVDPSGSNYARYVARLG